MRCLSKRRGRKKPLAIGEEMHKNLFVLVHTCKFPTVNSLADILQKFKCKSCECALTSWYVEALVESPLGTLPCLLPISCDTKRIFSIFTYLYSFHINLTVLRCCEASRCRQHSMLLVSANTCHYFILNYRKLPATSLRCLQTCHIFFTSFLLLLYNAPPQAYYEFLASLWEFFNF